MTQEHAPHGLHQICVRRVGRYVRWLENPSILEGITWRRFRSVEWGHGQSYEEMVFAVEAKGVTLGVVPG